MAIYEFKGMNKKGQNIHGRIEAESISSAQALIKKSGVYLVSIKDKSKNKSTLFSSLILQKIDVKTLAVVTRNLSSLIKSGIPLVEALDTVSKQTNHPLMAEALTYIKDSVNAGKNFHTSLEKFPNIFNKTYTVMCESGELSGTLDSVLLRLAQLIEDQSALQDKVRSALIYPAIILLFAISMIIFLLTYVVPKVQVLFEENINTLPWYSSFLLQISNILRQYWISIIIAFLCFIFALWKWKNSSHGQKTWDHLSLNLPIFGNLIRSVIISRMSRTLSNLLKGGVTLVDSLDIVKNVVNNQKFHFIILSAKESIERGGNLSLPLIQSGEFPPMVTQMLRIGEKTGQLERMLTQISETYDNQIKTEISALTSLLEPVMLIIMGGIIAFIIFSTMIPLMQMYNISSMV